jgi:hypothetical protein
MMVLFSVQETAVTGIGKTLKQDAVAARARIFAADPTSTQTRTTKGNTE